MHVSSKYSDENFIQISKRLNGAPDMHFPQIVRLSLSELSKCNVWNFLSSHRTALQTSLDSELFGRYADVSNIIEC